ncbi:MAG: TRAP transporter large permease [Oscillibacter sp.]|jgi:C4-dicarboxylate transporter DctM subunit|nr:TRAP transporter large permease [Oscillibacter sp.]
MNIIVVVLTSFFVLVLLGFPIAFSMGIAGAVTVTFAAGAGAIPLMIVPQRVFVAMDSFSLMAIPFFILAGELMNSSGITRKIVQFAGSLVGHVRGGLAHVNILASVLFAGLSGSAVADAASIGGMLIPAMEEDGYDADFSVAVTAASACVGPIIPPSICAVVYSSMSGLSTAALFAGGVVPGLLLALSQMVIVVFFARKRGYHKGSWRGLSYVGKMFISALPALVMPLIILGGILSGIFSATEAGVVACVYGAAVGLASKELRIKDFPKVLLSAAQTAGTTMLVIGFAQVLSWLLTRGNFATILCNGLFSLTSNTQMVFILLLIGMFILGFFIDTTALLILAVPVIAPIIATTSINPYHFGNLAIIMAIMGACTPPVGVLLFVCCGIAKIPVMRGAKALAPFLVVMCLLVLALSFCPGLVTGLSSLIS